MQDITITVPDVDAFNLLMILQDYSIMKSREIEQTCADEQEITKTVGIDDFINIVTGMEAFKRNAKQFMKLIQRQTGERVLCDKAIDKL